MTILRGQGTTLLSWHFGSVRRGLDPHTGGYFGLLTETGGMLGIIVWLIIGLLAGLIARAVVPGADSMGVGATLVLGLIGSLVGGFLGNLFVEGQLELEAAGIIGSIIGAVIALLIYRSMGARSRV